MTNIVEKLKKGENLSFEESKNLFADLMEGKHSEGSIIEILESFIKKGETKDELAGGIFILRDKANKVKSDPDTIDQRASFSLKNLNIHNTPNRSYS